MTGPVLVEGFSHLALSKEIRRQQLIRTQPSSPKDVAASTGHEILLGFLDSVSSLDSLASELAAEASKRAVDLASQKDLLSDSSVDVGKFSDYVEKSWNWVQQTVQMSELHVKNAGVYHHFHHSSNELQGHLDTQSTWPTRYQLPGDLHPLHEASKLTGVLKERLSSHMRVWQRVENLILQSRAVVPVHLRSEPLRKPKTGIWLCHYSIDGLVLTPDEEVTVLETGTSPVWRIRTTSGKEAEVPSVGCLIPGPDLQAIDKAHRVRELLGVWWEDTLDHFWSHIQHIIRTIVRGYIEGEITVHDNVRSELMVLLTDFDVSLVQKRGSGVDPMWKEELERSLDQLSKRQRSSHTSSIIINTSGLYELQELIGVYKEHIKQFKILRRQIKTTAGPMVNVNGNNDINNETDIEKLISRTRNLSEASTENGSIAGESVGPGDGVGLPGRQRVSRLYWQVPGCIPPRHISVTRRDENMVEVPAPEQKYRSRTLLELGAESEGTTVRRFEVSPFAEPKKKSVIPGRGMFTIEKQTTDSQTIERTRRTSRKEYEERSLRYETEEEYIYGRRPQTTDAIIQTDPVQFKVDRYLLRAKGEQTDPVFFKVDRYLLREKGEQTVGKDEVDIGCQAEEEVFESDLIVAEEVLQEETAVEPPRKVVSGVSRYVIERTEDFTETDVRATLTRHVQSEGEPPKPKQVGKDSSAQTVDIPTRVGQVQVRPDTAINDSFYTIPPVHSGDHSSQTIGTALKTSSNQTEWKIRLEVDNRNANFQFPEQPMIMKDGLSYFIRQFESVEMERKPPLGVHQDNQTLAVQTKEFSLQAICEVIDNASSHVIITQATFAATEPPIRHEKGIQEVWIVPSSTMQTQTLPGPVTKSQAVEATPETRSVPAQVVVRELCPVGENGTQCVCELEVMAKMHVRVCHLESMSVVSAQEMMHLE